MRTMAHSPAVLEGYLGFSRALNGGTTDADIRMVRQAGYTNGEIAEIIAHVALNIFTNYFNKAAGVEVDFPRVALGEKTLAVTR